MNDAPWREIRPLQPINGDLAQVLASVDALRAAWKDALDSPDPLEFTAARQRSLRRHAIETGIIERLYDVDWGVTEALVAEGLSADVAARQGGIDDDALVTINAQFDALTFLADWVSEGRDLSLSFIKQLHAALCRQQRTYEANNDLGQTLQLPLAHGAWKSHPNHVRRADGSLLEYTPPEHVQAEMERLIDFYLGAKDAHPVTLAAWLHHTFIVIHPFEDGNGRVARALTLLVLLRGHYAPLVVDRSQRSDYIAALDRANDGDLRDLVRLFARLEIVALRSELERPAEPNAVGVGAVDVARSYVARLQTLRAARDNSKVADTERLAGELQQRITAHLNEVGAAIREQFIPLDPKAGATISDATPPAEDSHYWRAQIIRAAKEADFFVNLASGVWWSRLQLRVLDQKLRFVAVTQKVGHGETGVLAVTVFAEAPPSKPREPDEQPVLPITLLRTTDSESATLVYTDNVEARWPEVRELLDRTLAAAVAEFAAGLD